MRNIVEILRNTKEWSIPEVGQDIPHGDMPGDKVEIGQQVKCQFPAFSLDSEMEIVSEGSRMEFTWRKDGCVAMLHADLKTMSFVMEGISQEGTVILP